MVNYLISTNKGGVLVNCKSGQMSLGVSKDSIKGGDSEQSVGNMDAIKNLDAGKEEKPQIVIGSKDLSYVQAQTNLDRQAAIDLITKCNGDIKLALRTFVLE